MKVTVFVFADGYTDCGTKEAKEVTKGMGIRAVRTSELPRHMREALADLPRFTSDHQYFRDNREPLLRDYDGQWVAVYNQEVVSAGSDRDQVIASLEEQGIRPSSAAVHYVTSKERLYFF